MHRLGPKTGAPKPTVPNYLRCTAVRSNSIANLVNSPVSALPTQWRFFAFSSPNWTDFQGGSCPIELSVCSPYCPLSDGKVISNSDDQIFGKLSKFTPPPKFLGASGGPGGGFGKAPWGALVASPKSFAHHPLIFGGHLNFGQNLTQIWGSCSAPRYRGIAFPQFCVPDSMKLEW